MEENLFVQFNLDNHRNERYTQKRKSQHPVYSHVSSKFFSLFSLFFVMVLLTIARCCLAAQLSAIYYLFILTRTCKFMIYLCLATNDNYLGIVININIFQIFFRAARLCVRTIRRRFWAAKIKKQHKGSD